jgi:putative heme transporter
MAGDARSKRWLLRVGLQVVALGIACFFFYRQRHVFQGFVSAVGRLRWPWVAAAVAAELASIPPLAQAQRLLLRTSRLRPKRWQMILVTLASNAISMSIPAGVAVAEGYAYTKYRWLGAKREVAAWAELGAGAIAFSALAGLALAGAIIAGGPASGVLLPILSVVWVGSLAAAELFRHPALLTRAVQWLERHVGRRLGAVVARASRRVRDSAEGLGELDPSLTTWLAVAGMSAVNWLLDTVCLVLAFVAVGATVPWGVALLAFAGTKVVSSSGVTPGGIGIVEGGLVATFIAYGINGAAAAAAVLVYRAITFVGLVGLGWLAAAALAARTHKKDRATSPDIRFDS